MPSLAADARGCSSIGRALAWHARGRGFDPHQLHLKSKSPSIQSDQGLFFRLVRPYELLNYEMVFLEKSRQWIDLGKGKKAWVTVSHGSLSARIACNSSSRRESLPYRQTVELSEGIFSDPLRGGAW